MYYSRARSELWGERCLNSIWLHTCLIWRIIFVGVKGLNSEKFSWKSACLHNADLGMILGPRGTRTLITEDDARTAWVSQPLEGTYPGLMLFFNFFRFPENWHKLVRATRGWEAFITCCNNLRFQCKASEALQTRWGFLALQLLMNHLLLTAFIRKNVTQLYLFRVKWLFLQADDWPSNDSFRDGLLLES